MMEITRNEARRFLLLKHGLLDEYKFHSKSGIVDYITQSGCIQYDPIDVCGKNHELVLQSRVKNFNKSDLYELLYEDRILLDCFDKNMAICLLSDWPHFEPRRRASAERSHSKKDVDAVSQMVLDYIRDNGAVSSSDLPLEGKVDWSWSPTTLARAVLDTLYFRGDLVIHHKKNTRKYYDLASRHIDNQVLKSCKQTPLDMDKNLIWNVYRRIKSVGLLHFNNSYAFIGIWGLNAKSREKAYTELIDSKRITEIKVSEISKPFYYCTEDKDILEMAISTDKYDKRIEFLAPLDNLLWDRKIISELFNFDYKWEVYTPKAERKYGYYVLPVLYGEGFAGRIELSRNKKEKRFEENIWMCDNANISIKDIKDKVLSFEETMY